MASLGLLACSTPDGPVQASSAPVPGQPNPGVGNDPGTILAPPPNGQPAAIPGDEVPPTCTSACADFPSQPLLDDAPGAAPPSNAATLFGDASAFDPGSFCVAEPQLGSADGAQPGALMPVNWLQPRFRFTPPNGTDLFEIRLSHPAQANDLVAYTRSTNWEVPADLWHAFARNVTSAPVTVTLRGVNSANPGRPVGVKGSFLVAPVKAEGSMVYWATTSGDVAPSTSKLVGFTVGEDNVVDAVTIPQVQQDNIIHENGRDLRGTYSDAKGVAAGHVQCIGCHVSTPDGAAVGFTDHWPWNLVLSSVEASSAGAVPSYLSPAAQRYLNQPWMGTLTFSPAYWGSQRIAIASYAKRATDAFSDTQFNTAPMTLAWFDLQAPGDLTWTAGMDQSRAALNDFIRAGEGTGWGLLALNGETRSVAMPSWSHSGQTIAYTSATNTVDGRIGANQQEVDIYTVPYNAGAGGQVSPLPGASSPGVAEYYPDYSGNDQLVAFNRVAQIDSAQMYYRADGEIFVTRVGSGQSIRLAANDPPVCTGQTSPGVTNSWAKWSPREAVSGGVTYYWLVFSSSRAYPAQFGLPPTNAASAQLYMAGLTIDASGAIQTYPAVYIWNQGPQTSNLTPAWDDFRIPPAPPRDVVR